MFLPKSKYTIKHSNWGDFVITSPQGFEEYYVGPYIEDYLGNTYAGTELEGAENRVITATENLISPSNKKSIKPVVKLGPKEEDYISGSYTRYFRQNTSTKVAEEIDEEVAKDSAKIWKIISGSWILTGSLDDQYIYGHRYRGVRYRNQKTLDFWEKDIRGLSGLLDLHPEDFVQEIRENS